MSFLSLYTHLPPNYIYDYFSKDPTIQLTGEEQKLIASHLEICSQCASLRGFIEECDEIADSIHFCTLSEEEKIWTEKMKDVVSNFFNQI